MPMGIGYGAAVGSSSGGGGLMPTGGALVPYGGSRVPMKRPGSAVVPYKRGPVPAVPSRGGTRLPARRSAPAAVPAAMSSPTARPRGVTTPVSMGRTRGPRGGGLGATPPPVAGVTGDLGKNAGRASGAMDFLKKYKKIVIPFLAIQTCDREPSSGHEASEVVEARWFDIKKLPPLCSYQRPIFDAALLMLEMGNG